MLGRYDVHRTVSQQEFRQLRDSVGNIRAGMYSGMVETPGDLMARERRVFGDVLSRGRGESSGQAKRGSNRVAGSMPKQSRTC